MNRSLPSASYNSIWLKALLVIAALVGSVFLGSTSVTNPQLAITLIAGPVLVALIFQWPFFGLAATVSTLPILTLLPDIQIVKSATSLLGALTVGSYFVHQIFHAQADSSEKPAVLQSLPLRLSIGFVFWIFVTHPQAISSGQNWIVTFFQLIVLVWLMGTLANSIERHLMLFGLFSLSTLVSALTVVREGMTISQDLLTVRPSGFAGGANEMARYGVIALVFLYFLLTDSKRAEAKMLIGAAMGVVMLSVIYTLSRTGFILIGLALGMVFIKRSQSAAQTRTILALMVVVISLFFVPAEIFNQMQSRIVPALQRGHEETNIRLDLWDAAFRMAEDNPVAGVGIGAYSTQLATYGTGQAVGKTLGAHNMYLQLMAETGIIGLGIYVTILGVATWNLWKASQQSDPLISILAWTWLTALVVMAIGGLTKHDYDNKMLWTCIGASLSFKQHFMERIQEDQSGTKLVPH
jgi:O-antigen ligase